MSDEMHLIKKIASAGQAPRPTKPPKKRKQRPATGARAIHDLYKKIRGKGGDPHTGDVPPGR